jgi:subtilisin family serine protease
LLRTCRGSHVAVCAPRVAIISTVPIDKYAALDGTSMASPVVAGLAALLIGRDNQIRTFPKTKQRTDLVRSTVVVVGLAAELLYNPSKSYLLVKD